ncbi:hypothetical protein [Photobacterium leiognathi]|uniref:hypothetical protein n=1 Tax=Photobacterium leiognathi TaxID=553611 RepID=UPI002980E822|nr:hypothetical protein [Photobacterium leiognathi]
MSTKKNKKSKGQQELNPLVALAIVAVVIGGAGYFLIGSDDSSDSYSSDTSTVATGTPTKTIIENVEAPDAKNAPMILPAKVNNLEVFNNNVSEKQHQVFNAKLDTELAQSNLVLQQLKDKSQQLKKHNSAGDEFDDFGMQRNYQPVSNYHETNSSMTTAKNEDKNVVGNFKSPNHVDVSMTTMINGKRLAVVKDHDHYKTVGVNNYVNGNMKVKSISEEKVCFVITGKGNGKTTCVAV